MKGSAGLSPQDRELLRLLQEDLPLCADPWGEVGRAVGLSANEVLAKLELWRGQGLIRKIGPSVNSRALGWFSTLCAANVKADKLDAFTEHIAALNGITHCYLRDNARFNLWFTVIAPTENEALAITEDLRARFDLEAVKSFPATELFKIKAVFCLSF